MQLPNRIWQVSQELAATARGDSPADLVVTNARLVNVVTGEIIKGIDVAVRCGRIALVGQAQHTIGRHTRVIDAAGAYVTPGFMDGHIHVESSMVTLTEYSKAVMVHGTTAIFMDPHEIANVLGMNGVKLMIAESQQVPLRVFTALPSCVPAAPGLEDNGASLSAADIAEAVQLEDIAALGEMMNFPAVALGESSAHEIIAAVQQNNKIVTGHFSLTGEAPWLNAYIAAGIRCDHESVRREDVLNKMRLGMYAQLREGSAWHDLEETIKCITESKIDTRYAVLISDDTHPHTLIEDGHMDHIVRRAIEEGLDPVTAIQLVTINCAQCYQCDQDLGIVAPGRVADLLLLDNLARVAVEQVIIGGEIVAQNGRLMIPLNPYQYPEQAMKTVNIARPLKPQDFRIESQSASGRTRVRVIQVEENKTSTRQVIKSLAVRKGVIEPDQVQDVAKAAVIERHHATGTIGLGFVTGFGLKEGAVASTVAHDSHNLLVVGTNDSDMALAANQLARAGGGMIAVRDGEVLAIVPLPLAGLMSLEPVEVVDKQIRKLMQAWRALGCELQSPFMTMALLALPVLPELRLTNRGLIDTLRFEFVDVEITR